MGRKIASHDDLPVREYSDFLKQFNRLSDCSWFWNEDHEQRDRFGNRELELLRAHAGGIVYPPEDEKGEEGISRSAFTLTQTRLAEHRRAQTKRKAVWISNDSNHDTLMMLIDVDKKTPDADVEGAAQYIRQRYLGGRGYSEVSTGGTGRHVYFFVDMKYVKRAEFVGAMRQWYRRLRNDPTFKARFRLVLDKVPVYGVPTLWRQDEFSRWKVSCRGNQLKVPYLPRGRADLALLSQEADHPLPGARLVEWAGTQAHVSNNEIVPLSPSPPPCNRRVVQEQKPHFQSPIEGTGQERRAKLYARMKRQNPTLTEDQFVAAYTIRTPENGGEEKVRKDFRKMEVRFTITAKADEIDFKKYLDVVKQTVPPLAMVRGKRKTKITHERVADFVAVKMHDAMTAGENQAASGRENMINFWRALKNKGTVGWTLDEGSHAFLVALCEKYQLLEVIEDYTAPSAPGAKNGRCRRIGPGRALAEEYERFEFTRRRLQADAIKVDARETGTAF